MSLSRRRLLERGFALLAALGLPVAWRGALGAEPPAASAGEAGWEAAEEADWKADWVGAFAATDADEALRRLFGGGVVTPSGAVSLTLPLLADNGASVPVAVATTLAGARSIALVVDRNPRPLAACFELGEGMRPAFATRIKLGETSAVRAVVQTGDGLFGAAADVTVTVGGCA